MNTNGTVQSVSPDVGSALGSGGNFSPGGQSEVLKQVLGVIEKKARNMEKKKVSKWSTVPNPAVSQDAATSFLQTSRYKYNVTSILKYMSTDIGHFLLL